MTYKKKHDKLMMLGKGFHHTEAPRDSSDCDVWVINNLLYIRQDIDLIWEMHKIENFSTDQMRHIKLSEELSIPIMMPEKYDEIKYSMEFPLERISKKFNSDYFMTAIAYMVAYAIDLGYKEIDMWGCNMGGIGENYKNARACVEYWIGKAEGSGMKVNLHGKHNRLLKTFDRRLYGYDDKFQWMPENITDKSLYLTFGCSLSNSGSKSLHRLLSSQGDSEYTTNYKFVPFKRTDLGSYQERKLVEDAVNYNIHNLMINQQDQPKHVGDIGFFYLPLYNNIIVVHHTFKMVYLTDDYDNLESDWMELSGGYNFWTEHTSTHWNGDKVHPQFDNLFPKYDAPKKQAFKAYHDFYDNKAREFKRLFPNHIKIADKSILDTEEGQREILEFIGYKSEDMVIRKEEIVHGKS